MSIDNDFQSMYRELEVRMQILAEADRDVFLPNPARWGRWSTSLSA